MNKKFRTLILLFSFFFVLTSAACGINENIGKPKNADSGIVIPSPAFKIELQKYDKRIKRMRQMLGTLDPEAARLIAFENAEKILTDIGEPFPNIKSH
jgi:hypothetical protein